MFIKRTSDTAIRVVFTNEIGLTFFDLELTEQSMTVHGIFPAMDRKSFLKILEKDFQILLFKDRTITKLVLKGVKKKEVRIYATHSGRGKALYFTDQDSHRLLRHKSAKSSFQRTEVKYTWGKQDIPSGIYLVNPTIRLHMYLSLLNE